MAASGIDPQLDYVFKRLFGSVEQTAVLADLLNESLEFPAGKVVTDVWVLNPFTVQEFEQQKLSILDIKACDQAGRRFNLEMQRVVPWSFGKRVLFYWAHLHIGQLLQGDYYETLMPSFSLCFLQGNFFPDDSFHHSFSLLDPTTGQSLTTDLEIHTFELSKFNLPVEQVQTGLHRWCYFLKHGASLDLERLPVQLDVPPIRQALEVLMKFSQDEIERIRILDRQKAIADATTLRIEAETALQRGLARGLESGEWIGRIHFAQEMLGQPATPRSQLEQLSLGQLEEMAAELRRQVVARRNGNQTETP